MWEVQGGGGACGWLAGSLTACLAVEISPGSYSVSVMECADEGERTGRLAVEVLLLLLGDSQIQLLVPCGIKIRGGASEASEVAEPPCSGLESSSVCFVLLLLCISLSGGHLKKNMTCLAKELVCPLWFCLMCLFFCWQKQSYFLQRDHDVAVSSQQSSSYLFSYGNDFPKQCYSVTCEREKNVLDV